jgi:hypothetical protein
MQSVERGQLRQWIDGSGKPFLIVAVDRSKTEWNVVLLKNGQITDYHENVIAESSEVLNAAR